MLAANMVTLAVPAIAQACPMPCQQLLLRLSEHTIGSSACIIGAKA